MLLAGIDIGTLTCRLLIGTVGPDGRVRIAHVDRKILRLGEGVDQRRRLADAAMRRVVETLVEWREVIGRYPVEAVAAVATSAVRDAANRDDFLELVQREAGFTIDVLTGEEEARRTLLGIRSGMPPGAADVLALDIGGGSTEFILDRAGAPPIIRSFDIGVVRVTERCFAHDPPSAEEIRAAHALIRTCAESVKGWLPPTTLTFVGTAGTITSLAAIAQGMSVYEPARIHQSVLRLDAIRALETTLLERPAAGRRDMAGVEPGREDVIAAGALIVRTVMETLSHRECVVSELGLREGVLLDLAARIRARQAGTPPRSTTPRRPQ